MTSLVLLMSVGLAWAQRPVVDISPVFARYGIQAVTGATVGGDAELSARLGPDVMSALDGIRSHIALIRNNGPHAITDVVWIWTGITSDGRRIPIIGRTVVGPLNAIKPGAVLVTAPSSPLTQLLMERVRRPGPSPPSGLSAVASQAQETVRRYSSMELSLDAIVLDSGTGVVLGPDTFGLNDSRRAAYAATKEISAKLNDSSLSDAAVESWLQEVGNRPFPMRPNGLPDHSSIIIGTARGIRGQIEQHGRAQVAKLLADVTRNEALKPLEQVKE